MTKKRVLLNISNHPTEMWNDPQKWGWDIIDNIPFPHVGAELSSSEVQVMAESAISSMKEKLPHYSPDEYKVAVYVAGEYTLSYMVLLLLAEYARNNEKPEIHVMVPASDRIINKDGSREFVFLQWREINLRGGAK